MWLIGPINGVKVINVILASQTDQSESSCKTNQSQSRGGRVWAFLTKLFLPKIAIKLHTRHPPVKIWKVVVRVEIANQSLPFPAPWLAAFAAKYLIFLKAHLLQRQKLGLQRLHLAQTRLRGRRVSGDVFGRGRTGRRAIGRGGIKKLASSSPGGT